LDPLATWQDQYGSYDLGPDVSEAECYSYYLDGDTMLNGLSYSTLRKNGMHFHAQSEPPFNSNTNWYSATLVGFLREDTTLRKVYIFDPAWSGTQEFLFYDLSVGIGPYPPTYRYGTDLEVVGVDSMVLNDGPHRRTTLNNGDQIVEGVGSLSGFMPSETSNQHWLAQLVCHTQGGTPDFEVDSYDCPCGSITGIDVRSPPNLLIGPSPTTGECRLAGAPTNAPFRVYSMDGRIVRSGTCSRAGPTVIDLTGLSAAIYVVEVLDATRAFQVKVIKE
jgi:hypothetical protein